MKRSPLARLGRRGRERELARLAFNSEVIARTRGKCERCGNLFLEHADAHHLLARSRKNHDDAELGACLCRRCHIAIHYHTVDDWADWLCKTEAEARAMRKRLDERL